MEKFMLNEAGELPELRQITSEKIDSMHDPEDSADFAFAREHGEKDLARPFAVLKRSGDLAQPAMNQVVEFGAELEMMFLRELEDSHHLNRIPLENVAPFRMQTSVPDDEFLEAGFGLAPQ